MSNQIEEEFMKEVENARKNSKYLNFEQIEIINGKLFKKGLPLIEHQKGAETTLSEKGFESFSNTMFETYGYRPINKYP